MVHKIDENVCLEKRERKRGERGERDFNLLTFQTKR